MKCKKINYNKVYELKNWYRMILNVNKKTNYIIQFKVINKKKNDNNAKCNNNNEITNNNNNNNQSNPNNNACNSCIEKKIKINQLLYILCYSVQNLYKNKTKQINHNFDNNTTKN